MAQSTQILFVSIVSISNRKSEANADHNNNNNNMMSLVIGLLIGEISGLFPFTDAVFNSGLINIFSS
jgi:hypothetical protein